MTDTIKIITNRWIVIPLVLVLTFAALLLVHTATQQSDDTAAVACRPVCTQWLGGQCIGRWIAWRPPYICYPY